MQSGVIYSMKGLKSSGDTENLKASVKLDQQVMQIPVLLNYKFTIGKFRMGTGAGGYYSYGIGGKTKAVGQVNGQDVNIKVNTFGNILRKNDVGLIFNLSTRLQHIALGLSYELGLLEVGIKNVLGQPLGYKNRVASVTVGYIF